LQTAVAEGQKTPALRPTTRQGKTSARRLPQGADSKADRQLLVYLTREEIRDLKIQAAHEGRPMSAIASDALRAYRAAHPIG
jgi:hypothetical protein